MLRSLFGSKAHARVFMPPGLTLPAGVAEAHRRRHPPATGQSKSGWECGVAIVESLSRVLACERHPELAAECNPAEQDWWAQEHRDYVNDNSAGDTDQIASGCGDLFLYYLHSQLTFDWTTKCGA